MTRTATSFDAHAAETVLGSARRRCEPGLRDAIAELPEPLGRMATYHFGWSDRSGNPTGAGWGKGLRAALSFAAATACGADPVVAVPAAVAVELIHNFTLVHDDVMDADRIRRGRATVWSVWGMPDAICLGDALHAAAVRVLVETLPASVAADSVARVESAAAQLCQGQSEDCSFETRSMVSVDEYLAMAEGKTAALLGCACALGAACAGADAATVTALDTFGRELGIAFQITDDLLGIWGDPGVTGKPAGNDVIRRKRTFPVVAALESNDPAAAELAALYRSGTPITPTRAAHAADLIVTAGGKQRAQQYADQKIDAALAVLADRADVDDLIVLAHLVTHRRR
ncbi:polyprenyl synthetase family protein [Nocardia wallacei]|uniref:polyprenyl synthetase family protein n=1 Tax=Nocardia wallacei TaxID=480035 RepID=UPI0024573D9C|nr:polyprenyl synthetase family protein [Nocardia wallacei]